MKYIQMENMTTKELLLKVKEQILTEPSRFHMSHWFYNKDENQDYYGPCALLHNCNTAACIAGWAIALSGETELIEDPHEDAKRILGITESQANSLFYITSWEEPELRERFVSSRSEAEIAAIAAQIIDNFIERHYK